MRRFINYGVIIGVSLLASYRSLSLYFWHDDFAVFYAVKNGLCEFNWPYTKYCQTFGDLYNLFGYNPKFYFLFGVILSTVFAILFYEFCKRIFNKKIALLLGLFVASGYFGADNFVFAYSATTTYLPLIFLMISCLFIFNIGKKWRIFNILGALIFFYFSLDIFAVRSSAFILIIPFIFLQIYKKLSKKEMIAYVFICFLEFVKVFFIDSWLETGSPLKIFSRAGDPILTLDYLVVRIKFFLATVGTFVFNDFIGNSLLVEQEIFFWIRLLIGLVICVLLFYILIKSKDKKLKFITLLASITLIAQYIPQGLVTEWRLLSVDRYMTFPFIGFVLVVGVFGYVSTKKYFRLWSLAILLSVVINLIAANAYLSKVSILSQKRGDFLTDLRNKVTKVEDGTTIYIDAPRGEIARDMNDFMRVGFYPTEVSVAAEIGVKYQDIKVITESDVFARMVNDGKIKKERLYSFYYDGNNLIDVSYGSKHMPWVYRFKTNVEIRNIEFDESTKCVYCNEFRYLKNTNYLKQKMTVHADLNGEDTDARSLYDYNLESYWVSGLTWYEGKKPNITVNFKDGVNIDGFVLTYPKRHRKPSSFSISVNGREMQYEIMDVESVQKMKVLFSAGRDVSEVKIVVESTTGEMPSLSEIDPISSGDGDINLESVEALMDNGLESISQYDKKYFYDYISSGVVACLKWKAVGYGDGSVPFLLNIDGYIHEYSVQLPSTGGVTPDFSIGCLNFPTTFFGDDQKEIESVGWKSVVPQ